MKKPLASPPKKHKITPHKGGRTEGLTLRLSPEEKKLLRDTAERHRLPVIDLILKAVKMLKERA